MLQSLGMLKPQKIITSKEELVKILLKNRGIKEADREKFFNPALRDFEKEFDLPGITSAKRRILQATKNKELVIVYGDYDVDGLCGAAILYLGLSIVGAKVLPYIPHREKEGFGMSETGLQFAKDQGAKLIVTVDNGITAVDQAKLAQKMGLDLIITDHHLPQDIKPEALSIIHSTKMCGAAVGWCLLRSFLSKKDAEDLLDLVALAEVSDMVPMLGVNRALVKAGLEKLNSTKRVGLLALINQAGLTEGEINSYHVGFVLGPRLNAKGRLEHAIDALRLLCTKDPMKARNLAKLLGETNDRRRQLVTDGLVLAKTGISIKDEKIILTSSDKWIPGITGLLAGKLKDEYGIPAVVICRMESVSKGSARSVKGVNIVEIFRSCSKFLIDVGGHPAAAGFTIETSKIDEFKSSLQKAMEKVKFDRSGKMEVDGELALDKIDKSWVEALDKFEPFGIGNPKPIFSGNAKIANIKTVGGGAHLKFKADGIDAIAFSFGGKYPNLVDGQSMGLAYYLEIDKFNNTEKLQLKVTDLYELSGNTISQKSL